MKKIFIVISITVIFVFTSCLTFNEIGREATDELTRVKVKINISDQINFVPVITDVVVEGQMSTYPISIFYDDIITTTEQQLKKTLKGKEIITYDPIFIDGERFSGKHPKIYMPEVLLNMPSKRNGLTIYLTISGYAAQAVSVRSYSVFPQIWTKDEDYNLLLNKKDFLGNYYPWVEDYANGRQNQSIEEPLIGANGKLQNRFMILFSTWLNNISLVQSTY